MPEAARKLVIFSDSRQDAAKLSAGIELDHFRDMVRVCIIAAIAQYRSGQGRDINTTQRNAAVLGCGEFQQQRRQG